MENIVAANHLRLRIGEKHVGEPHLFSMTAIDLGCIHADRYDANPTRRELGKLVLETPQLGVTEWSPKTAIKDKEDRICFGRRRIRSRRREKIAERNATII